MNFLLVHGAFRGGWSWSAVARLLRDEGHRVLAPSLIGMGELAPPLPRTGAVTLEQWCAQVALLLELEDLSEVIAVGHSQGALVVRAAAGRLGGRLAGIGYLDAPIPEDGQRGVDLLGAAPAELPPPDTWLEPSPLSAEQHPDPDTRAWMNDRLGPTPLGPSLEPIHVAEVDLPTRIAFCEHTPAGYPSTVTRVALDSAGVAYDLFDAPHDVTVSDPALVADWLVGFADPAGR